MPNPTPGAALINLTAVELDALEFALTSVLEPTEAEKWGDQTTLRELLEDNEEKRAPLVRAKLKIQKAITEGMAKHPAHYTFRKPSR